MKNKVKVLNINGWGRSGSTIVGSVLGQYEDFFYGGELKSIWNMSLIKNRLCGCGVSFKECPFWNTVFNTAFNGMNEVDATKITKNMQSMTRARHLMFKFLPGADKLFTTKLSLFLESVKKLLVGIQTETRCKVIVDSSKSPLYGYLLSLIDDIDVYIVHLVRDPRGVAYSKQKTVIQPTENGKAPVYMHKFSAFDSAFIWNIRNAMTESYWTGSKEKYLLVKYEDFAMHPKKTCEKILDLINEVPDKSPFISEKKVELKTNHSVWGNPSRFKSGTIELKLDEEWKTKMARADKLISTTLTLPLLKKYGYT